MTRTPSGNDATPPPLGGSKAAHDAPPARLEIGVFAKHWTPGTTKTRLAASIGPNAAAAASRLFLETTLRRITAATDQRDDTRVDYRLAHTPPDFHVQFAQLHAVSDGAWRPEPQAAGSLGARMRAYFASPVERGAATLLVGSDTPHLPVATLAAAIEALLAPGPRRAVFGPTEDGGYWLIGCRGQLPPVFDDDLPWSEPSLLAETTARLQRAGWREGEDYRLVDGWYDIDDADDLRRLRSWLTSDAAADDAALNDLKRRLDELLHDAPACDSP